MLDVGVQARDLRRRRGWTQAELAERLGVSRAWVVRLEQGSPRLEAQRVLDAFVALGAPLAVSDASRVPGPAAADPFAAVFEGLS